MSNEQPYVSRGGLKLAAALDEFALDVPGMTCADLGCNVGGFTDCLLQHGAQKVYAVDTAYGTLAWTLRQDPRVIVLERTNALHFDPATIEHFQGCDLVTIDLGWTRQKHAVPAALSWLKRDDRARLITLIKPHYEVEHSLGQKGVLDDETASTVAQRVIDAMPTLGVHVLNQMPSPIRGGGGKGRPGNIEFLALLRRSR